MARGRHLLSAKSLANLKTPGRYKDGDGLFLLVREGRESIWIFRYKRGSREDGPISTDIGLGMVRDVPLSTAREKAALCRHALADNKDPRVALAGIRMPTFGEVADDLVAALKPGFKSTKHAAQWEMTLTQYCAPIRGKPVDHVGTDDVLEVLKPIWQTKPETASRVRGRIERVLDNAKARKLRSGENPAAWRGHLSHLLSARPRLSRGHHRALPWKDAPDFMARLRELQSVSALALEWTILTASRTNETVQAELSEVDPSTWVWTIPARRMKANREHRVPLGPRAIEIYKQLAEVKGKWLFPGPSVRKHLSLHAMAECLKGLNVDATVHGFRSTFRDWVGDATSYPDSLAEAALAHVIGDKTEAAYRRGDALERRRDLMAAWERYLENSTSIVVSLRM